MSGNGKTTIAEELSKYGLNQINSYTTRKPRYEGEKGHIFATVEDYRKFAANDNIAGFTVFDSNYYWTTKEQIRDRNNHIYVVDPDGVRTLKKAVPDVRFVTIYIQARVMDRIDRMYKRGDSEYQIEQRMLNDEIKFEDLVFDYAVTNDDMEKTVKIIKSIIDIEMND
jgi:guanylate kinase